MSSSLTQAWLRQAAVPYTHKEQVCSHVENVLAQFNTLRPKTDVYTFDDGRVQLLICVHGTIPIGFKSSTYNIPVAYWLPFEYPRQPPIAYVVPTSDMLVKKSEDVDPSGRCRPLYVRNWERKSEGCDLSSLIQHMQQAFATTPPVYAKPKQGPTPSVVPAQPLEGPPPSSSTSSHLPPYHSATPSPAIGPEGRPPIPSKPSDARPASFFAAPVVSPPPLLNNSGLLASRPPPPLPSTQRANFPSTTGHGPQPVLAQPGNAPSPGPPPPVPMSPPSVLGSMYPHPVSQTGSVVSQPQFTNQQAYSPTIPQQRFSTPMPPPMHMGYPAMPPHMLSPAYQTPPRSPPGVPAAPPYHAIQNFTPPGPSGPSGIPRPPPTVHPTPGPTKPAPNFIDANDNEGNDTEVLDAAITNIPARPPNPQLLQLQSDVHQKLVAELGTYTQALTEDAERLRSLQSDALTGEPAIRDEMARLVAVRDVCQAVLQRTRGVVEAAEANVADLKRKGDPEVDELVCSTAIVYNQLINLVAEDNAIEDTIYHLHRALNAGRIDLDRFVRTIRVLAEEQFMKRALIEKIRDGLPMGASMMWN